MDYKSTDSILVRVWLSLKALNKRQFVLSTRMQLFIFSFLINLLVIPLGIASPNGGGRYLLTKTIVENNSFSWPATWLNSQSGFWFFPDFGINNGFISDKAPGLSFLLVPVFIVVKILYILFHGQAVTNATSYNNFDAFAIYFIRVFLVLVAAATAVRMYDLLNLLSERKNVNIGIVLITSFGTLFFLYTPSLFPSLITGSLYILIVYHLIAFDKNKKYSDLLVAGILSGFAVVVEYGTLLMIPWFAWYIFSYELIFHKKFMYKELVLYGITVLIGILPLFIYNVILSGNPLQTSYYFSHWITQINFYNGIAYGLWILLFNFNKGLFILSPVLILGCLGFANPRYYKKHIREVLLIALPCIVFMIFYAKNFDPSGGTDVGPRYIIPLIPLLAIGLQGWFLIRNRFASIVNSILIFISFRNAILLVLGIGVFPLSSILNPVYGLAIPQFIANSFNPILPKQDELLFVTSLLVISITIIVFNYDRASQIKKWMFSARHSTSQSLETNDATEASTNASLIPSRDIKILAISTLWLFNVFLLFFITIGVQYLSRGSYPNINLGSKSDYALLQIIVILSALWSIKEYTHFNIKQFIKGA